MFVIGSSSLSSGSADAAGPLVALLEKKRRCSGVAAGYTSPSRLSRLSGVFIDGIKYSTEYTLLGSSHCCRVARNHCTVTLSRNPESMSVISEPTGVKNTSSY